MGHWQLRCVSIDLHARSPETGTHRLWLIPVSIRSIRKHGDYLGQASCKQHASPTRPWDEVPPCCDWETHPPLFRCHLTPPVKQGSHGASSGHPPKRSLRLTVHCFILWRGTCVCVVCRACPEGSGVAHVALAELVTRSCFRSVFWPATADPSWAALTPTPNATQCVHNAFSRNLKWKLEVGVGPGLCSAAA